MFRNRLINQTIQIAALGAAVTLCAAPGSSEPEQAEKTGKKGPSACKLAYKSARDLEQSGHLLSARETYRLCAKATCSAFLKTECSTRYTQIGSDIPSVVPTATDAAGMPRDDVQVTMDGALLTSRLDGRAYPIDPGVHEFSFTAGGGVIATQKLTIVAGQRNQPISVAVRSDGKGARRAPPASGTTSSVDAKTAQEKPEAAPLDPEKASSEKPAREKKKAPQTTPDSQSPVEEEEQEVVVQRQGPGVLPFVIGGVGLAGLGVGALLTVWGRKDNDSLAQCTPNCPLDSVDHINRLYTIADISYGVGAAALGVSAILFATSGSTAKEKAPAKSAYMVDVKPTPNGAFATVSGRF